jgi:hypothetical protein
LNSHIIDNYYDTLAAATIFVHASRFAWHNDDPDHDALATLRNLKLDYIQSSGYVNLRCVWVLGCPVEIPPHIDAASDLSHVSAANGRKLTTKEMFKQAFEELMPGVQVPHKVGVSCCSQFAVSRKAVRSTAGREKIISAGEIGCCRRRLRMTCPGGRWSICGIVSL